MTYLPTTNDKRQRGINSLDDDAPLLADLSFDAVFDREFTSDVHFFTYNLIGPDGEPDPKHPRINKRALPELRDQGAEVVTVALVMDFDLQDQEDFADLPVDDENKPLWSRDALGAFLSTLPLIDEALRDKGIGQPIVYTTLHGGRFVHRLSKPVPAEEGEDLMRGLIKVYADIGVVMDKTCTDWTRLFRAPKVVRKGVQQGSERWFTFRNTIELTDPAAIDPITRAETYADRYANVAPVTASKPTPEQADARLYTTSKSGRRATEMHKTAQRILKGTECYGPCFDGRPIADEGGRDHALVRLVGSACTRLLAPTEQRGEVEFAPEDIYALFLAPVQDLEPDAGTPDWTEALWSKVTRFYEKEQGKLAFEAQQKDARREEAAKVARSLLDIVRETCDLPELHSEDETTAQIALRRLMLVCEPSGRFRALKADGGYSETPVAQARLHNLIRTAGLEDHIPLVTEDEKGKPKPVTEQALARRAVDVLRVEGAVGIPRSHVVGEEWDRLVLRVKLYQRNPTLGAEFSQAVDDWLELLTDQPDLLRRWLAYSLDFESGKGIAALSLAGAANAGKGMLAQGLVETLERPARADKSVLVGRFNDTLQETPFLIVDEGLPKGDHDIADMFRQLTAGEPIKTEAKYQTPIEIRNPMRILFTANNLDVVNQLASDRMNNAEDQAAIAQRLVHLDVRHAATAHLQAMGGYEHTKGWIMGADGSGSDYTLARHLLWLYENRSEFGPPDGRLLVEGNPTNRVLQAMRLEGTVPEAIGAAIVYGIESKLPLVQKGISTDGDRLFVTSAAIQAMHDQRRDDRKTNIQLTPNKIGAAMSNLLSPGLSKPKSALWQINLLGERVRQRFWDVDVRILYEYAERAGFPRANLEKLVIAQYGEEALTDE